jgi:hypothetical protein
MFFLKKNAEPIHKFDKVITHHILQSAKASTSTTQQFFVAKPMKKIPFIFFFFLHKMILPNLP